MKRVPQFVLAATLAAAPALFAQGMGRCCGPGPAPIAGQPTVEVKGKITSVQAFKPGQGMPTIQVASGAETVTVRLGSMRYLMEQDFSPKAGMEIEVKGYKLDKEIVAIEVKTPADGKVLKLRDTDGRPVWMGGGPMRRGRGRSGRW